MKTQPQVWRIREKSSAPGKPAAAADSRRMPGQEGVWILVFGDIGVFTLFFATFFYYRSLNPTLYAQSAATLDETVGIANTILLLTSSWLVARGVRWAKDRYLAGARRYLAGAMLLGACFVLLELHEYSQHIRSGHTINANEFFMFYFMYTGIHLVHVFVGLGALLLVRSPLTGDRIGAREILVLESGGAFWHLVDMLWVMLFAIFYLVR